MLDKQITIPAPVYDAIAALLQTGIVEQAGVTVDFSKVQTITVKNGKMTLNPPAAVSGSVAGVRIRTTISEIRKQPGEICIDINNSPMNVELLRGT